MIKEHDKGKWSLAYLCAKIFILFKCHTSIDQFIDIFPWIYLPCHEKAQDNKDFDHGN